MVNQPRRISLKHRTNGICAIARSPVIWKDWLTYKQSRQILFMNALQGSRLEIFVSKGWEMLFITQTKRMEIIPTR